MGAPTPRPGPGKLDLEWSYLSFPGGSEYAFSVYGIDGSDRAFFVDPRQDPQPHEVQEGRMRLGMSRWEMTEVRDMLDYLLKNWGAPDAHESHPEEGE
jgi:hypothetical protein